jgi:hypothetical protein
MARSAGLPQKIIDFIPTHHGTALIEYFYQRAKERRAGSESDIQESEFRYPGPKPTSRESAILMLADSVEAASRSLSNPTHQRLEALIDAIFKSRVEDGQLENTDLTFRELNEIKETFLSLLLGMYHVRVKYPGQERIEQEAETNEVAEEKRSDHEITDDSGHRLFEPTARDTNLFRQKPGPEAVPQNDPTSQDDLPGGDASA